MGNSGNGAKESGGATPIPQIPRERQFVHLHLHSEYSLLDGGNRVDRLIDRVKHLGMTAVAVTDHGNMFGAIEFYQQAKEAGIRPILGVEAYVAPRSRLDRTYTGSGDGGFHLVLLAENETGWKNLLALCSEAFLTGFYYKPRIDRELLEKHASGLIAINGHLGSEIGDALLDLEVKRDLTGWERAVESARWHARVFADEGTGPRFFIEMQHHVSEQNRINPHLMKLARELNLPLVCDNDAHFLNANEHDAHDTLICISMSKTKDDPARLHYPPDLYVKSPGEMRELFEGTYGDTGREACDNTVRIAERCNLDLKFGNHAPMVDVTLPEAPQPYTGGDLTQWFKGFCARFTLAPVDAQTAQRDAANLKERCDRGLRELAEAGLVWRYGPDSGSTGGEGAVSAQPSRDALRARLDRELRILADKGISPYFLIVWDFVNWARQQGIPAMARGSGVGTMVGYALGLSNACPVRYGLLFERFTDPDRSEYPDIDIDLCQDGRGRVIDYVRQKYGHVAQIITFGTLKARAAVRDVGRVFAMPIPDVDRIAKLIPEQLGVTLDKALDQEPDLKKAYDEDPQVKRIIDTAKVLEGQARHASVHAAGVIVATRPLHEIVPLYRPSGTQDTVTQWDGPTCEKVGLLKMDFLGLRTLSTIERCKQLIVEGLPEEEIWEAVGRGDEYRKWQSGDRLGAPAHPLDLDRLSFDDPRVFAMFQRADTTGVFQFESGGMRRLLVEMKPDRLEDLIAANALFRPGPMDLIPAYNRRKHGQEDVPRIHPIVEKFTAETYGVMVYQEQVMQIVHELGGIPLRAAYSLIKAISKKKEKEINARREQFIAGAQAQGLAKAGAEELFDLILKFAGYGFNKSHSTGYAIVAYQTAYLKTYFPNQYMAAFLSFESQAQKVEDWMPYKDDCRKVVFTGGKVGVDVRPPDINLSDEVFSVVFEEGEPRTAQHGHVRFGLRAIKGAGDKAIGTVVGERRKGGPYTSLYDLCERVSSGAVNKATIEALVCSGSLDSVHGKQNRAAMVATIDSAVSAGQSMARDRAAGQHALFGFGGGEAAAQERESRPAPPLVRAAPWDESAALLKEKEVLGFYVSSHPLDRWAGRITMLGTATTAELKSLPADSRAIVGGLIKSVRPILTRNGRNPGERMAIVSFEDTHGSIDCVLFVDAYRTFAPVLMIDSVVFLAGRVDHSRGDPQLIVDRVAPVERAPELLCGLIELTIDAAGEDRGMALFEAVASHLRVQRRTDPGATPALVRFIIRDEGWRFVLETTQTRAVVTEDLLSALSQELGDEAIRMQPAKLGDPQRDRPRYPPRNGNGHNGTNGASGAKFGGARPAAAV